MQLLNTDLLRVYAILGVVFIHVASPGLQHVISNEDVFWEAALWDAYARASVPVFFMITGYLFLNRLDSVREIIGRSCNRILIPLLFWSVVYLLFAGWYEGRALDFSSFTKIFQGPVYFHLWYLYAIFFVYLSLPLVQKVQESELQWYFFLVWFLFFSCLPVLRKLGFFNYSIDHFYTFFSGYMGYIFLGAILGRLKPSARVFLVSGLGVLFVPLLLVGSTYWLSYTVGRPDVFFTGYTRPLTVLYAGFVFVFFFQLYFFLQQRQLKSVGLIRSIAECSFGIYLVHIIFYRLFSGGVSFLYIGIDSHTSYSILSKVLFVFLLSWGVTYLARQVPLLRRVF